MYVKIVELILEPLQLKIILNLIINIERNLLNLLKKINDL